jgi:hypothetical protein
MPLHEAELLVSFWQGLMLDGPGRPERTTQIKSRDLLGARSWSVVLPVCSPIRVADRDLLASVNRAALRAYHRAVQHRSQDRDRPQHHAAVLLRGRTRITTVGGTWPTDSLINSHTPPISPTGFIHSVTHGHKQRTII